MNFFTQLAGLGQGMDVVLRIKGKNGRLTVMVEPQLANNSRLKPLILTATPEELDEGFIAQFDGLISVAKGLESNLPEVRKDAEDLAKAKNEKKSTPAKPPAPSKEEKTAKGGKPKKEAGKKKAEKPAAKKQETAAGPVDMFSQPIAGAAEGTNEPAASHFDFGDAPQDQPEAGQEASNPDEFAEKE